MRYKIVMALWFTCGAILMLVALVLLLVLPRRGEARWRVMPPPR